MIWPALLSVLAVLGVVFYATRLTSDAKARLRAQLEKVRDEFAELHRESLAAPFARRNGACMLVAQRDWEPRTFAALRRDKK